MKRIMKRFSAVMLALCMVLAMSVPAFAATTTLKTKTASNAGTCVGLFNECTNYGWLNTYRGYNGAKIKLSTSAVNSIKSFCSANKVKVSVPSTINVVGTSHQRLAWASKSDCGKVTATLKLLDTNGDKKADYLKITLKAAPKKATTSQGNVDTYVGAVKVAVKK